MLQHHSYPKRRWLYVTSRNLTHHFNKMMPNEIFYEFQPVPLLGLPERSQKRWPLSTPESGTTLWTKDQQQLIKLSLAPSIRPAATFGEMLKTYVQVNDSNGLANVGTLHRRLGATSRSFLVPSPLLEDYVPARPESSFRGAVSHGFIQK